jgi:hypothetical protein
MLCETHKHEFHGFEFGVVICHSLVSTVVMFHIFLVSETQITGLCHLQHGSAMPMVPLTWFHTIYVASDMIPHHLCHLWTYSEQSMSSLSPFHMSLSLSTYVPTTTICVHSATICVHSVTIYIGSAAVHLCSNHHHLCTFCHHLCTFCHHLHRFRCCSPMFQPPPFVYILPPSVYVLLLPHPVDPFKTWTYCPMVLFLQSVIDNQMETDWVGDTSGRRSNLKESIPELELM